MPRAIIVVGRFMACWIRGGRYSCQAPGAPIAWPEPGCGQHGDAGDLSPIASCSPAFSNGLSRQTA